MNAKEYLSGAWKIKLRIESMTEVLAFLRSAATYTTSQYSDTPGSATRNVHKNEDAIVRLMDFEERVRREQRKLNEVLILIANIADPTEQAVIVKRYVERKTWGDIASEIYVSEKTARNIHATALIGVEKTLEKTP